MLRIKEVQPRQVLTKFWIERSKDVLTAYWERGRNVIRI